MALGEIAIRLLRCSKLRRDAYLPRQRADAADGIKLGGRVSNDAGTDLGHRGEVRPATAAANVTLLHLFQDLHHDPRQIGLIEAQAAPVWFEHLDRYLDQSEPWAAPHGGLAGARPRGDARNHRPTSPDPTGCPSLVPPCPTSVPVKKGS